MGVSKNKGTPKWMVKMNDLGVPLFSETSISKKRTHYGFPAIFQSRNAIGHVTQKERIIFQLLIFRGVLYGLLWAMFVSGMIGC